MKKYKSLSEEQEALQTPSIPDDGFRRVESKLFELEIHAGAFERMLGTEEDLQWRVKLFFCCGSESAKLRLREYAVVCAQYSDSNYRKILKMSAKAILIAEDIWQGRVTPGPGLEVLSKLRSAAYKLWESTRRHL